MLHVITAKAGQLPVLRLNFSIFLRAGVARYAMRHAVTYWITYQKDIPDSHNLWSHSAKGTIGDFSVGDGSDIPRDIISTYPEAFQTDAASSYEMLSHLTLLYVFQ